MVVDDPLAGCDLKLGRAQEHLSTLQGIAKRWLPEHPVTYDAYVDQSTGEKVFFVSEPVEHPPDSTSVIFGEFLYALRSSLDHLAWQLVIRAGGTPDNRT